MNKTGGEWKTLKNGVHVFIYDGETEEQAISRQFNNPTIDSINVDLTNNDKKIKEKQLEIINKYNPMLDDYHTGIRTIEDIKTPEEAFKTKIDDDEDYVYPDFTEQDGLNALKTGKITIYSSKEIEQGGFVSTSKMMAQDYAGSGKVYSKEIDINDVAWINSCEGQFAKIGGENNEI